MLHQLLNINRLTTLLHCFVVNVSNVSLLSVDAFDELRYIANLLLEYFNLGYSVYILCSKKT